MSKLKLYSFNLADQESTTITASSENAFYPASNIKDPRTTKVFRSVTGILTANIVFDFNTSQDVDAVLIVGDAVNGIGFSSLTIEANTADSWGAPAFTTTLTPSSKFNSGFKTFTTQSYRYWRLVVTGAASYAELSNVFIGKELGLDKSINFGWGYQRQDLSKNKENGYGQQFSNEKNKRDKYSMGLTNLTAAQFTLFQDALNYNGTTKPAWMILDEDATVVPDAERFTKMMYFEQTPRMRNSFFGRFDFPFKTKEAT